MSIFAVTADEQGYSRELRIYDDPRGRAKPMWSLDAIDDVIAECEREGAAIMNGQILEMVDGLWQPLPWAEGAPRVDILLGENGASLWKCWRNEGEPWDAFVARSAAWAREMVPQLAGAARYDSDRTLVVDLAWVTPDEVALFDLPAHVRDALARGHEDGTAVDFRRALTPRVWCAQPVAGSFHGGVAEDLAAIPAHARFLRAPLTVRGVRNFGRLEQIETLVTDNYTDKTSPFLRELTGLRVLHTYTIRVKSLDGIRHLNGLRSLKMDTCRQLADWSALEGMPDLRVLEVGELALSDLTPLGRLRQLRGLYFFVDRPVESIAPLAELTELRALRFWGGVADGSLAPLAALRQLRTLELRTQSFKLEAFADLAAALPATEGPHRSPFVTAAGWQQQIVTCPKCGTGAAYYTLGKPTRLLCEKCDATRIAAYVAQWEILVSAARVRLAR